MANMVKVMRLLNRAVTSGKLPKYCLENLQAVENPTIRENLMTYVSKFANKTSRKAQRMKAHADDFTFKLKMCNDDAVKESAEKLLESDIKRSSLFHLPPQNLTKAELLLDSVNSAESKYVPLTDNIYERMKNFSSISIFNSSLSLKWAKEYSLKGKIKKAEKEFLEIEKGYSEPHKLFTYCKRNKVDLPPEELIFEQRYNSLKKIYRKNSLKIKMELHTFGKSTFYLNKTRLHKIYSAIFITNMV